MLCEQLVNFGHELRLSPTRFEVREWTRRCDSGRRAAAKADVDGDPFFLEDRRILDHEADHPLLIARRRLAITPHRRKSLCDRMQLVDVLGCVSSPVVFSRHGEFILRVREFAQITNEADPFWLPLGAPATNSLGRELTRTTVHYRCNEGRSGQMKNFTPPFPAYPSGHAPFGLRPSTRRSCFT
jgi:hypothetical protein